MTPTCPCCSTFKPHPLIKKGDTWECGCGYAVKVNKGDSQN